MSLPADQKEALRVARLRAERWTDRDMVRGDHAAEALRAVLDALDAAEEDQRYLRGWIHDRFNGADVETPIDTLKRYLERVASDYEAAERRIRAAEGQALIWEERYTNGIATEPQWIALVQEQRERADAAEHRAAEAEGDTALLREYGEADAARRSHAGAEHAKVIARSIAATEAIEERGRALALAGEKGRET